MFFSRWRSGFRTGALSRRRTKGRTRSCALWFRKQRQPAVSSDCWSRGVCWRLQACRASYPTVAAALWALPCALPPWPWPAMVAVAATAAAAALERRAAALHYPPLPAQGQWQACRVQQGLTASSASQCPPYSAALPPAFPPIPFPWQARWLATCRNFPHATWALLPLSLTRGPMAKNPWTRKFWNDTLLLHNWVHVLWTCFGCFLGCCCLCLVLLSLFHMSVSCFVDSCTSDALYKDENRPTQAHITNTVGHWKDFARSDHTGF